MFEVGDKVKHINPSDHWKPKNPNAIGTIVKIMFPGTFYVTWSDGTWEECASPMTYPEQYIELVEKQLQTLTTTESYV